MSASAPNFWQRLCKRSKPAKFVFVAHFAPPLVVTILLASSRVAARGLNMAIWGGADPHVGPRWRNSQTFYAEQALFVGDCFIFCIKVVELISLSCACVPGAIVTDVKQTCLFSSLYRTIGRSRFEGVLLSGVLRARGHGRPSVFPSRVCKRPTCRFDAFSFECFDLFRSTTLQVLEAVRPQLRQIRTSQRAPHQF